LSQNIQDKFKRERRYKMGKIIIEGNDIPEGETEEVVRRVKNALAQEFEGSTITDEMDKEGNATLEIDAEWTAEETAKEEERKRQRAEDKKAINEFSERARELAKQIPDADLPSEVQLYSEVRKYDYKIQLATEKLAEKELAEGGSPSDRVRIYGRGSAY
jgi:vacuolar-type H+-ATPase subunit I/STV1